MVGGAPLLTAWLFGPNWLPAVPCLQLTALALAPVSCVHAVAHTLQVIGRQPLDAVLVGSKVVCLLAVLAACRALEVQAPAALGAYAITVVAFSAVTLLMFRRALQRFVEAGPAARAADAA